jgi:hypothetical protein
MTICKLTVHDLCLYPFNYKQSNFILESSSNRNFKNLSFLGKKLTCVVNMLIKSAVNLSVRNLSGFCAKISFWGLLTSQNPVNQQNIPFRDIAQTYKRARGGQGWICVNFWFLAG